MSYDTSVAKPILGHIYEITDAGHLQLALPGGRLTSFQQELLLRIDGRKTQDQIDAEMAHADGVDVRRGLLEFESLGWVMRSNIRLPADTSLDFTARFGSRVDRPALSGRHGEQMRREAEEGAAQLERRGYYLSITRPSTGFRTPRNGSMHTVLVIEDDPHIARLLRLLLESEGFLVELAKDRGEVQKAFNSEFPPDVVLLDVVLPDLNGVDVLRAIRAHPVLEELPVIMLSARGSREDVLLGLENGASGYITKPFDLDNLIDGVNAVLGNLN